MISWGDHLKVLWIAGFCALISPSLLASPVDPLTVLNPEDTAVYDSPPPETKSVEDPQYAVPPQPTFFHPDPEGEEIAKLFPVPPELERRVRYWRTLFVTYPSTTVLIYSEKYPDLVFETFESDTPPRQKLSGNDWRKVSQLELQIQRDLRVLAQMEAEEDFDPASLSPSQLKIFNLFSGVTDSDRFTVAAQAKYIDATKGLRDVFEAGLIRSGRYADRVRALLIEHGTPQWFVALPFIESMYNPFAFSDDEAAGMWQFIRPAGKVAHLRMDRVIDERRDPFLCTVAAADKLTWEYAYHVEVAKDLGVYDETESLWPQTTTGYNFGYGAIEDGMRTIKSTSLGGLLFKYKRRSKGFDVKNFYAEFVAALDIYRNWEKHFPNTTLDRPWSEIAKEETLPKAIFFRKFAKGLNVDPTFLRELNPSFGPDVLGNAAPIPKNTIVRFPIEQAGLYADLISKHEPVLASNWTGEVFDYLVQQGDSLWVIARKFGVALEDLVAANNLADSKIVAGIAIKIPKI